jgi:hypothetical protein
MSRLVSSLVLVLAASSLPAVAADWSDESDFRGSYLNEPKDWSGMGDPDDEVGFEFGMRYWYSMGTQTFGDSRGDVVANSQTHSGEVHLRVDDYASRSYVKGVAGYSAVITGDYANPYGKDGDIVDGNITYAGGDFGWNTFGDGEGSGIGLFAGYQYWNDSPRTMRSNFVTAQSAGDLTVNSDGTINFPGDSSETWLETQSLRLGISGRARLGGMFDISGELAAVPISKVQGAIASWGNLDTTPLGNPLYVKTSTTTVDGWGYGAMGEMMLGVTPLENLTFRVGGRAWYLTGTYDARYSAAYITDPVDTDSDGIYNGDADEPPGFSNQSYIETQNPFSLFRYGLLAELTYAF